MGLGRDAKVSLPLTLAVGALGALAAQAAGVPLAPLTGSALAVAALALAGRAASIPVPFRNGLFLLAGLGIGTGVTPEAFDAFLIWPAGFAMLALSLLATMGLGTWMMSRLFGMNRRAAFLASTPGHLSFVLAIAEDRGDDSGAIAVIQTLRVLILTLAVPFAVHLAGLDGIAPAPRADLPLRYLVLAAGLALILWPLCQRLRIPAPSLMAALFAAALLTGTGFAEGRAPDWITQPALAGIGTLIGARLASLPPRMILRHAGAGLASTALAAGIATLAAIAVHRLLNMTLPHVLTAFAPGGLETMLAIGAAMGANPGFTAAAHVARLLMLSALVPVVIARL